MSAMNASRQEISNWVHRIELVTGRSRWVPRMSPMEELVCCMLSQSSSDVASFPAFTRLREKCPEWRDVESMDVAELAMVIQRAGLANQKANAIQGTLRAIREKFGDYTLEPLREYESEAALEWLTTLPGVGPKTANLVLCFCFFRQTIPVDTHVHRVAGRLGMIPTGISAVAASKILAKQVDPEYAFRFHMALIQFGRQVCLARQPRCAECTLRLDCPGRVT